MKSKGKFIVFEGLDGCGKTTQLEFLRKKLNAMCEAAGTRKVFVTREPSDNIPGVICRGISKHKILAQPETEALLYAADRYEHIKTEILPQLEEGSHVLCDRYYFSNFAYQGSTSDLRAPPADNKPSMDLLRADATIYIDVAPKDCEHRRSISRAAAEKYENIAFATAAKERYFRAFDLLKERENVVVIDGSRDAESVFASLWGLLGETLFTEADYR